MIGNPDVTDMPISACTTHIHLHQNNSLGTDHKLQSDRHRSGIKITDEQWIGQRGSHNFQQNADITL